MIRRFAPVALALAALPLLAQQNPAPAPKTAQEVVATINGEVVTKEKLDFLWERAGAQMRAQYEQNGGGKAGFLDNYINKRLLVQEAMKRGFDKKPAIQAEMEAAKESALFDRYVRDVIAEPVVSESAMKKYYDEHSDEFKTADKVRVRHIVVTVADAGPRAKSKEQAIERMQMLSNEIHSVRFPAGTDPATVRRVLSRRFSELAQQYSEDGSAEQGGDLGWIEKGTLDPTFEDAAFNMAAGTVSGVIQTPFGYHLIYVEEKKPAGMESFVDAKPAIREFLMTQHAADVMQSVTRLTNELRAASKVAVHPENIK